MSTVTDKMGAFQKLSHRPDDAAVVEVPVPVPGPGEALVEVAGCGVCGSDLHAVRSDPGYESMRAPVVLGHECAGHVVATGPDTSLDIGTPVVAVSIQGCGQCSRCHGGRSQLCDRRSILGIHQDGGLARYVRVLARHLVPVPGDLDPMHAVLAEPLAVVVHAVLERSSVSPGSRVVVTGPGPIGLLAARVAVAAGAEVLVLGTAADAALRLPLAEQLGATAANLGDVRPAEAVEARFGQARPDLWLEAAGAVPAFDAAVDLLDAGGQLTLIAQYTAPVEMFVPHLLRREITVACSYAANAAAFGTALRLLADGVVPASSFVTSYPLAAAPEAIADVAAGRVIKPVVVPGS